MLTNYVIEQYEPIALAYISFKLQKVLKVILWHVEGKIVNFKRAQLDKLSLYVYDLYTGGTAYWPSSIKETKELTNSLHKVGKSANLKPTGNLPTTQDRSAHPEKYYDFMLTALKEICDQNAQLLESEDVQTKERKRGVTACVDNSQNGRTLVAADGEG